MLTWLTVLFAALVVAGLALYLILVAWALHDARKSVTRIADALEQVADGTTPLGDKLGAINGALSTLAGGLDAAHQHLGRVARVFRL